MREFPKGEMAEALHEKLFNPEKKVKCPTCGDEIVYKDTGSAMIAKCKKCDIYSALRGL